MVRIGLFLMLFGLFGCNKEDNAVLTYDVVFSVRSSSGMPYVRYWINDKQVYGDKHECLLGDELTISKFSSGETHYYDAKILVDGVTAIETHGAGLYLEYKIK